MQGKYYKVVLDVLRYGQDMPKPFEYWIEYPEEQPHELEKWLVEKATTTYRSNHTEDYVWARLASWGIFEY